MSRQTAERFTSYNVQNTPKLVDAQDLTTADRHDLRIICHNGVNQRLIHTKIPYRDHNNREKLVVVAVYEIVYKRLPARLPDLLPPPVNPSYVIRDVPGKGKGMIATRNIIEGEIVIVERPVVVYPNTMVKPYSYQQLQDFSRQAMDPQDWKKYNDLENVLESRYVPNKFLGIALTNSCGVHLGKGNLERYAGVFLEISRINHSCGPNLGCSWNLDLFAFSVQAVRPIQAGQELTIPYEDICDTHANRRRELERKYKFQCECGYCTNTSPTSDLIRSCDPEELEKAALNFFSPRLTRFEKRQKAEGFIRYLIREMTLKRKEGVDSRTAMLHYVTLMTTYGFLGDTKEFKRWGFKAVLASVNYTTLEGREACLEVEQWIGWIKEPKTFPSWNGYLG